MIIIGIIVAILMFSGIVIIHELGHFLAARFFGVKVEEFGLGIPPKAKVIGKDKKGTVYTLNWLPLGGFVRLKGENGEQNNNSSQPSVDTSPLAPLLKEEGDKSDRFIDKSYFAKTIILLGGVFMNFLLASIIFSVLFFVGVKPIGINSQIQTDLDIKIFPTKEQALKSGLLQKKDIHLKPIKDSIAEKSGILKGDILLKINNQKIDSIEKGVKLVSQNAGKEILINIKRKNNFLKEGGNPMKEIKIKVGQNGQVGMYLAGGMEKNNDFEYKYGLIDSIKYGFTETYNQSILTIKGIGVLGQKIFAPKTKTERQEAVQNMKGPIGIFELIAIVFAIHGIKIVIIFGAIISINLGVFNLLPIPALDGGRWLLITISTFLKKIFGEKINTQNFENLLHLIFFVILIALSLIIGYNDIENIINR